MCQLLVYMLELMRRSLPSTAWLTERLKAFRPEGLHSVPKHPLSESASIIHVSLNVNVAYRLPEMISYFQ